MLVLIEVLEKLFSLFQSVSRESLGKEKKRKTPKKPLKGFALPSKPELFFFFLATSRSKTQVFWFRSALGYKKNFMVNSAEHEILNAHKCKNIK